MRTVAGEHDNRSVGFCRAAAAAAAAAVVFLVAVAYTMATRLPGGGLPDGGLHTALHVATGLLARLRAGLR